MEQLPHEIGGSVEAVVNTILRTLSFIPGSAIVGRYIKSSHQNDPARTVFELLLLLFALRYFFASKQSYNKRDYVPLSDSEIEELISEWKPEPLSSPMTQEERMLLQEVPVLSSPNQPYVEIEGGIGKYLNFTSTDIYGFSRDPVIKEIGLAAVDYYGVGSCGPAGFYGNEEAHSKFEKDLAEFLGVERAIMYPQGYGTASSVIACFAKRGDVLVADEFVNMSIQKGMQLSRAKILWYKHNDMEDLEVQLRKGVALHHRGPLPRRFIITEALFETRADSPDLRKVFELKAKYKFRLMLDESWSLGVLGRTGRGLVEEAGLSRRDVEITFGTLASAVGTCGGYCAGEEYMVEHQRIVSLAFTFTATCPPYLAECSSAALKRIDSEEFSTKLAPTLRQKTQRLVNSLERCSQLRLLSRPDSPIIVFTLVNAGGKPCSFEQIDSVVQHCRHTNVLISRLRQIQEYEMRPCTQAIRLYVSIGLSDADIDIAGAAIISAVEATAT